MYGMKINGYDNGMMNEREVRAGAGILFFIGFLALTNAVMLGHTMFAKVYVVYFSLDMLIRVINPFYSPTLILGRLIVSKQNPEYIAAKQKRLAWFIGLVLSIPMVYFFIIDPQVTIMKIFVCMFCLFLLLLETSFGFCLGCFVYNNILISKTNNCTGGCELKQKYKILSFNKIQILILFLFLLSLTIGTYLYLYKTDTKTNFGYRISKMFKTKEELKKIEDEKWKKAVSNFDKEPF